MANDTPPDLRNLVIYSIFMRNHGPRGTFADVEAVISGKFTLIENRDTLQAAWRTERGGLLGVFNVQGLTGEISVPLPDGAYRDELDGTTVVIAGGKTSARPASIFRYSQAINFRSFKSSIF